MQSSLDKYKSFCDCGRLKIKSPGVKCGTHHSCCTEPCQECFWVLLLPASPSEFSFWRFCCFFFLKKGEQRWKLLLLPEDAWNRAPSGLSMLSRNEATKPCLGHYSVGLLFVAAGADLAPELSHWSSRFLGNTLHMCACTWAELREASIIHMPIIHMPISHVSILHTSSQTTQSLIL